MKLSVRTEFRVVVAALLIVAAGTLAVTVVVALTYRAVFGQPWHQTFVHQYDYRFYIGTIRKVFFIIFPCIALLNAWAAWKVLKYAKKIQGGD